MASMVHNMDSNDWKVLVSEMERRSLVRALDLALDAASNAPGYFTQADRTRWERTRKAIG